MTSDALQSKNKVCNRTDILYRYDSSLIFSINLSKGKEII